MALLAGVRVIGAGDDSLLRGESFDSKQVTIWPEGDDGVRVREIVDIDFGSTERHGYQRIIPNDFGAPESVTVVTEADDTLDVVNIGDQTRIRVGDPNITYTGRHRYELEYVLPNAGVSSGVLVARHDRQRRDVRDRSLRGGAHRLRLRNHVVRHRFVRLVRWLRAYSGRHRPLRGGHRTARAARRHHRRRSDRRVHRRRPATGARTAARQRRTGFARSVSDDPGRDARCRRALSLEPAAGQQRRSGAGGAAEAAFGDLPEPGSRCIGRGGRLDTSGDRQGTGPDGDDRVRPARGLDPWQGMALLRESVDDETVLAWFSGMVAKEALVVTGSGKDASLVLGPKQDQLSLVDQAHLARLFAAESSIELGKYDSDFAVTWRNVVGGAGGFHPRSRDGGTPSSRGGLVRTRRRWHRHRRVRLRVLQRRGRHRVERALACSDRRCSPSSWASWCRSASPCSPTARWCRLERRPARRSRLRTESFRRFLASSEGKHVDWAWEHGVLREYSAWAVALGAADAWSKAISSSNIPDRPPPCPARC